MKKEIWHSEDKEKVHKNRKQEQRNLSESRNKEVMVILLVVPAGIYGSYLHPILFVESYACNTNILFSGNSLITSVMNCWADNVGASGPNGHKGIKTGPIPEPWVQGQQLLKFHTQQPINNHLDKVRHSKDSA